MSDPVVKKIVDKLYGEEEPSREEQLEDILLHLVISTDFWCNVGPNSGKYRVHIGNPYLTPDQIRILDGLGRRQRIRYAVKENEEEEL